MEILYSDEHIVVCAKPVGILSQGDEKGSENMISLLSKELSSDIYPVHRLDRNTGGVMVYAKSAKAAAKMSAVIENKDEFLKEYLAVVEGIPENEGEVKDLLYKSARDNKAYVVKKARKGVKEAFLSYKLKETARKDERPLSLILVRLFTGRFHQIRVQFASRKMPLAGDGKYGSRDNGCELALWSHRIAFRHPFSGEKMNFISYPGNEYPWNLFDSIKPM